MLLLYESHITTSKNTTRKQSKHTTMEENNTYVAQEEKHYLS